MSVTAPLRSRIPLTDEQSLIVSEAMSLNHGNLKVAAGAGTGKTATSVAIAENRHRTGSRILYLAYNKAIAAEAKSKFRGAAHVYTVHGIAFRGVGVRYLNRRLNSLYPSHVSQVLNLSGRDLPGSRSQAAQHVLQAMTNFLYSPDEVITEKHLPYPLRRGKDEQQKQFIAELANEFFMRVAPDSNSSLPLPHDVYLKYWHLIGSPGLEEYDLVLMDEAQDSNGVTIEALASCPAVTWVGDSHQQIYAFRGALDAMSHVKGHELPLTQSFRYGEATAELANRILSGKQKPPRYRLRGLATRHTEIGPISPREAHTRLYRTNVELLRDAMHFTDKGERIAIVGDQSDLKAKIESAWRLRRGERKGIRHPLIAMFSSWKALEEYAEDAYDQEINQVLQVIDEYDGRLDEVIRLIGNRQNEDSAKVVLTTAHRAKGREWPNVVLSSDFDNVFYGERKLKRHEKDAELNLLYVAVTRATDRLDSRSEYVNSIANLN